ncbi:MAG: tRNA threonylcarbamoyladenosine dehydratase [Prevotella sp.]|nr:tRNA threonylcarbamoyladenosine dehydratase [Prevotella sp.]
MEETIFQRTELLIGKEKMECLGKCRVILFGVGGVGSWCAESLVRSGIRHLTLVDFDTVNITNINRQLVATMDTIGRAKVEVLRERLLAINPDADINAMQERFSEENASSFNLGRYDYIIDAIDSVKDKALLILMACQTDAYLFSSMGAALKMDPSRIQVAEFWKVHGDPLARALRYRFKRKQEWPAKKFLCVFSDERLENDSAQEEGKQINGTVAHITAIFGFTLASMVVGAINNEPRE